MPEFQQHYPGGPWEPAELMPWASRLLPVWCVHAIRWEPEQAGYRPTVIDLEHPDLVCRDVGAIPETCSPIYGYNPKDPK